MQIKLIPDKVLKLSKKNDLLGTKPYSDTIFEIIKGSDGEINLGLFGRWGSGKSTILSTLEELISNHNKKKKSSKSPKIGYFEFDAWKYSKDDFRRSFIIQLNNEFNIKPNKFLKKLLYSETSVEDPKLTKTRINWLSLPNWLILFLVLFSFVFYFSPILDEKKDIKAIISLFALLITLLSTAANNTITKYKVVVKDSKIIEPERFENIFDEIVSSITSKNEFLKSVPEWIENIISKPKYDKLVIVIDNLDRCDNENLLTTLNTVKNFLENKKVIFILPVDEKSISAFLSKKTDNADEYLRKVFHIIIRLKPFSKKELLEFTKQLNKNYKLNLTSSSIRIICQEFTNNPRKVIQFLNNYQSEMKLIEEQSELGYIDGKFVKQNLSFYIKLLIIKSEWHQLYSDLLYDRSLLNKINNAITSLEPDVDNFYPIDKSNIRLTDGQRNFFYSTQSIHCTKIDSFILNIDLDKDIPDDIEDFIRYSNYNGIDDYLNNDNLDFTPYDLLKKINEVYSNFTFKHREYAFIALPILNLLVKFILDEKQLNFKKELIKNNKEYIFLTNLFENREISTLFAKLNFEDLCNTVKWFLENINDDLYNSFIKYLKNTIFHSGKVEDNEEKKINIFFKIFSSTDKISDIKKKFSVKLTNNPKFFEIESLQEYGIASRVISPSTIKKSVKKLLDDKLDIDTKSNISNITLNYLINNESDSDIRHGLLKYYVKNIEEFYNNEKISESTLIDYEIFFEEINLILNEKVKIKLNDGFKAVLTLLNNYLFREYIVGFNEKSQFNLYKNFFTMIKNFIFYSKGFNQISYRTDYFGQYLTKDISNGINLLINDILYEDVDNHDTYDYQVTDTLIEYYKTPQKDNFAYARTLLLMIQKSNSDKGLSEQEIIEIVERTVILFYYYSHNKDSHENLRFLKKYANKYLIDVINDADDAMTSKYVEKVKLLNDKWFYGDSIINYLEYPLNSSTGTYQNFTMRLRKISKKFTIDEQYSFIRDLLNIHQDYKTYKWLKLSYSFLPKKVFDIYLEDLIYAHKNKFIKHNDFFEWILIIPKNIFYKKRLTEYLDYLRNLDITHKTYKPKKENALAHLIS